MPNKKGEIVIYKTKRGETKIEAKLENETVWLDSHQMGVLFGVDRTGVVRHIKNIYKTGELSENLTCAKIAQVAKDGKVRKMDFYNLDMIISVGYRVNSKRAAEFRIWATRVLKEHLIKGYAINEARLKQRQEIKLTELEKVIRLFQDARVSKLLNQGEADGLLEVITEYANTWVMLERYDKEKIIAKKKTLKEKSILDYEKSQGAIAKLKKNLLGKKEATGIFAQERGHGLEAILGNLNQTFSGRALYPSIEQKAAHLLYFVIKDHPFVDGNKRIGSFLFVVYLSQNKYLFKKNGEKKINDNALVALALLVAQSQPREKDLMIALITNLL